MATKKQKKDKSRAARLAQRDRVLAKENQLDEDFQEEELPEEVIPVESLEKEMGEMYMGPTSWEESYALEDAREQASQINTTVWKTEDLVRNILFTPMLDPKEKVSAMKKVADGFEERVAQAAKPIKKDLDILVIKSILAVDKRHSGPLEFVGDLISKAKLTASAENALDDSQFALVKGEGENKVRKYPIHDKAHVRNALARAAQMIEAGGEAAADAKAAMPKIRAAAKKMGIEMSMEKENNSIMIEKDLHGDWRWIGWVSNNFIDYDGDIISKAAHEEYVTWLDANPELAPVSTTWHLPEMVRKNATDFWAYEDGFLIMSGKLTEDEAESLLKAKIITDIGMSHQSLALERDPNDRRVVTKYRMYECSDLPLENAANPFTNFDVLEKEADMNKKDYLAQFIGEEKAESILQKAGLKKEALDAAGVESKEKQDVVPETPAPAETAPQTVVVAAAPVDEKALIEKVIKELGAEELSKQFAELKETAEKVPLLEALVKELQTTQDEKLAEKLTPPAERFSWLQKSRASTSEETVLKEEMPEDQKLKKSVPEVGWFSEVTRTQPVV